jgi:hypothetical protein
VVEVVLEGINTIAVIRVFDVKLSRYTDDQVLDLSQRGGVELVGEQLTRNRITAVFTHRDHESVLRERSAGEFLVDLSVGVEKSSSIDERLVPLDTPQRHTGTDRQTLFEFVKKVPGDDAIAGGIDEFVVLCLLIRCVSSNDEIFVDLAIGVNKC